MDIGLNPITAASEWFSQKEYEDYVKSLHSKLFNYNELKLEELNLEELEDMLQKYKMLEDCNLYGQQTNSISNREDSFQPYISDNHPTEMQYNRLALFNSFIKLEEALKDVSKYIYDLYTLSNLQVAWTHEESGKIIIESLSKKPLKSAIMLSSLVCKYPFIKSEEEKNKIKLKIQVLTKQHQEDIQEYIKIYHDSSKRLYDQDRLKTLNKVDYFCIFNDDKWLHYALKRVIDYTKIINSFMQLNEFYTLEDMKKFVKEGEWKDFNIFPPEVSDSWANWFLEKAKFPVNNELFKKNRFDRNLYNWPEHKIEY